MTDNNPAAEYTGPATLELDGATHDVEVTLRGAFQPIDGQFHWWGRVATNPALDGIRSGTAGLVRTPHGSARTKLSDRDPWGRFRLTGTGRPPF